jgi:diguanylate cyclase (GGDEF)-like protein
VSFVARCDQTTTEERARTRTLEFDSLVHVSSLATESLDLDAVLPRTLAGIAELLPADRMVVLQQDEAGFSVRAQWASPNAQSIVHWGAMPGAGRCQDQGVSHYPCTALHDAAFREALPYLVEGVDHVEALVIPLRVDDQTVGRLDIIRENGLRPFDAWEHRFADACGRILSLTVRNGMEYARVVWLAEHDALTGIGNRRQFDLILSRELKRAERYGRHLSLLLIDLDDFKEANSHLGLSGGDDILRRTATVLADGARKGSDIACRIGGDEFALILPEVSEDGAHELAQRLRRQVAEATAHIWPMRFSYSVSTYPHIDSVFLRRNADVGLRNAKTQKEKRARSLTLVQ